MPDVVIVGGGASGLAAAYELTRRGASFVLLEAGSRLGGVILTEQIDGFTVDAGPDSMLVQKPAAIDLCRELGLDNRLVPMSPPRTAYVLRKSRLVPLPEASYLGVPTELRPIVAGRLLSPAGKLRMAMDLVLPRGRTSGDESIGSFFGRRFGRETVEYVAEPLLAGIHAGDVDRLSMRALFPRLLEAEARHGSVIRSLRRLRTVRPPDGVFRSLAGGIGELVAALGRALPSSGVRLRAAVERVDAGGTFRLGLAGGGTLEAARVILAVPAYTVARLVAPFDAALADLCDGIPYQSTAAVVLAYPQRAVSHPLRGTGFVVPRVERAVGIMAASWVSSKWPNRAPPRQVLLRAFVGGARDPRALDRDDRDLAELSHRDLAAALGIGAPPSWWRVYRWERANAQHEVGHLDRLRQIEARLAAWPGLFVTGSGFRGVGIPDCVADGRATAAAAAAPLISR